MAVKVAEFGATAVPMVHSRYMTLAAHQVHCRPTIWLIGPYMMLEHPTTRSTAALLMLMLDGDVSRSLGISDTTENREVDENVAASAIKEVKDDQRLAPKR